MESSARGLEIEEDPHLEKKLHWVRVIGWTVFSLILLAALLGLLGSGPLSTRRPGDSSAYVEFNRFDHANADSHLIFGFAGDTARSDTLRIELERSYFDRVWIERIEPEPLRWELAADRVVLIFARTGELPKGEVRFEVRASRAGTAKGTVKIGDAKPLLIEQFFFP